MAEEQPIEAKTVPTSVVIDYAQRMAKEQGISPDLARGIILAENSGKNGVLPKTLSTDKVSPKGATGIGQIMPETYEGLKSQGYLPADHSMSDWRGQVDAVLAAIKAKQKEHRTNDPTVIAAAYNGGNAAARNVQAGNYSGLPAETIDYLAKLRKLDVGVRQAPGMSGGGSVALPDAAPAPTPRPFSQELQPPEPSSAFNSTQPAVDVVSVNKPVPPVNTGPRTVTERGIDALMELTRSNSSILDNLVNQVTQSSDAAAVAHADAAGAVITAGQSAADAERIKAGIEAAGAYTRERVLKIANMNTADADNAFSTAMAERFAIKKEREALRPEIDERMAVGLFDNPIQYLINQAILPGKINKYNALAQRETDNITFVDGMQGQVKTQEAIDLGAVADQYIGYGVAVSNAELAKAQAKASEMKANSAAFTAQKVLNIASLRERQVGLAESALKWMHLFEEKADRTKLKEDEQAEVDELNKRLRLVGDMIGVDNVTIKSLKGQGKTVQEMWMSRQGSLSLGDSFPESFEFIRRFGNLQKIRTQGAAEFADMQREFQRAVEARASDIKNTWSAAHPELSSKPPNDESARLQAAEELQKNWYGQRDIDMFRSDKLNPYRISHYKQAISYKGDPNNPVFQMVKDAQKHGQEVNDKVLFDATSSLVADGILQPREAASAINEYYADAVGRNNMGRSLKAIGLDAQSTYRVRPEGSSRPVDLLNFVDVENYITRIEAARRTPMSLELGGGIQTLEHQEEAGRRGVELNKRATPSELTGRAKERLRFEAGKPQQPPVPN